MTHTQATDSLVDAVRFVQEAGGRACESVGASTRPFDDLEGFDSLNALEVLVQVSEATKVEIPDKVLNKIVKDAHVTISDWAKHIVDLVEANAIAGE